MVTRLEHSDSTSKKILPITNFGQSVLGRRCQIARLDPPRPQSESFCCTGSRHDLWVQLLGSFVPSQAAARCCSNLRWGTPATNTRTYQHGTHKFQTGFRDYKKKMLTLNLTRTRALPVNVLALARSPSVRSRPGWTGSCSTASRPAVTW